MTLRIGGFSVLIAVALGACATAPAPSPYDASVAASAIKTPDFAKTLMPIPKDAETVRMAHIQPYPELDPKRFIWVSLPEDLRAHCRGKADPTLAMQQSLGLPPDNSAPYKVFLFEVPAERLFRPCISGGDVTTTSCALEMGQSVDPSESVPAKEKRLAVEQFVLSQILYSYQSGGKHPGYPFTGMGWSYDWNPANATHQGVSEYVLMPGELTGKPVIQKPEEFCS